MPKAHQAPLSVSVVPLAFLFAPKVGLKSTARKRGGKGGKGDDGWQSQIRLRVAQAEREDATLISESKKVTFYVPDKRALN